MNRASPRRQSGRGAVREDLARRGQRGQRGQPLMPYIVHHSSITRPVAIILIALLYGVIAKNGFLFAIPPGNISPVFPAAGIALAAVLILGRPALIGVWLGSFVANGISFFDHTMMFTRTILSALLVSSCIGGGATVSAGVGAQF